MIDRESILNTLRSRKPEILNFGITQIGLFGSFIRGEESTESDIDILIVFDPDKESFDNFMAAYDYFENLFKNKKIEMVTKNSLSPYIGPSILKEVEYA
jgi:predicted nucleotidyltransferase